MSHDLSQSPQAKLWSDIVQGHKSWALCLHLESNSASTEDRSDPDSKTLFRVSSTWI